MTTEEGAGKQRRAREKSPLLLLILVIAVIYFVELGIMLLVIDKLHLSSVMIGFIDSSVLIVMLFPALYFLIFKPLISLIVQLRQKEGELRKSYDELEIRVEQRTAELQKTHELSSALNTINASISSSLDFNQIMQSVVGKAAKALNVETGWVTIYKENRWIVEYICCLPSHLKGLSFSEEEIIGIVLSTKARKPFISNNSLKDARLSKELVKKMKLKSVLAIPLFTRGKAIGILYFTNHTKTVPFSEVQVDFANKLSASLSLAIENVRLYEAEHNIAETLQEALLKAPVKINGLDFGYLYRPASDEARVGGDFYDLFELEHNKVGIVVGDVSGKGLEAATLTSLVKNTIKAYACQEISPASTMKMTNDIVVRQTAPGTFVTAFLAILDVTTGDFRYCNSGHPLPIVKRKSQEGFFLTVNSAAIGNFENETFIEAKENLQKGDSLILYTDGIVEARCKEGRLFGDDRLLRVVDKHADKKVASITQTILDQVMKCTIGKLQDDVVLLAIGLK